MASTIQWNFVKMPTVEEIKTPQARIVLEFLERMCKEAKGPVLRTDLVTELEKPVDDKPNAVNARQAVSSVVGFYQKRLADGGFIEVIKPPKPVTEKKAKAPANKGSKAKVPTEEAPADVAASMSV